MAGSRPETGLTVATDSPQPVSRALIADRTHPYGTDFSATWYTESPARKGYRPAVSFSTTRHVRILRPSERESSKAYTLTETRAHSPTLPNHTFPQDAA
jgi:hypothetical protein